MRLGVIAVQETMNTEYLFQVQCNQFKNQFESWRGMRLCYAHEKKMMRRELGEFVLEHVHVHGRDEVAARAVAAHQYPGRRRGSGVSKLAETGILSTEHP
jgi:hypothetical protein